MLPPILSIYPPFLPLSHLTWLSVPHIPPNYCYQLGVKTERIISDRPKAYGMRKWIRSDSCRIRSRIRLVINGYGKGYGFTNIQPYPKIYLISRLYPTKYPTVSCWVSDWGEKIKESYTFCFIVHKHHHARHKLVLYEYIFMYVEKFTS
jgi:hypothetical protein